LRRPPPRSTLLPYTTLFRSRNAFDRKIDHDTPWRSKNDLGGISLNADIQLGAGTLTSTTAWRYWNWGPSNDRDFTGLSVLSLSQDRKSTRLNSSHVKISYAV